MTSSRSLVGRNVSIRAVMLRNCSSSLEISSAGAAGTLGAAGGADVSGSGCGGFALNESGAGAASGSGSGARG